METRLAEFYASQDCQSGFHCDLCRGVTKLAKEWRRSRLLPDWFSCRERIGYNAQSGKTERGVQRIGRCRFLGPILREETVICCGGNGKRIVNHFKCDAGIGGGVVRAQDCMYCLRWLQPEKNTEKGKGEDHG